MKKVLILLLLFFHLSQGKTITVFFTNDEHGSLLPKDYAYNKIRDNSMASIASLIKKYRAQFPHSILLSGGDTFQGNPAAFYYHYIDSTKSYPLLDAMNLLEYDGFVIGNHDVEQGVPFLKKIAEKADFPFLSANAFIIGTDSTAFQPYIIKTIDGIKMAILGLTTPGIPLWLDQSLYKNIEFRDMTESAKFWLKKIKTEHQPDIIIGLFHSGLNEEWDKEYCEQRDIPLANASYQTAQECQEFDLIITGHSHRLVNDTINEEFEDKQVSNTIGRVKVTQAKAYCQYLGISHIVLEKNEAGNYYVDTVMIETVSSKELPPDSAFMEKFNYVNEDLDKYMTKVLTHLTIENFSSPGVIQDLALTDLIHRAQLKASKADLSIASNFSPYQQLKSGPVTVSDIFQLYKYENTLITTELSGKQIKDYLEFNSRYYHQVPENAQTVSYKETINQDIRSYNFDTFEGLAYTIDISKPIGERICIDSLTNGEKFQMEKKYTVAMNNYRFNGGGGFISSLNLNNLPKLNESSYFIRDIIIDYLSEKQNLTVEANSNWKIIPENLTWKK